VTRKEDFKRPDHSDFKDYWELKAEKFSGIRQNSISEETEIWINGEIRERVSKQVQQLDPTALERAYAEVFALKEVSFANPPTKKGN
jgi:hypothetical protein